jgi:hypothetical protein
MKQHSCTQQRNTLMIFLLNIVACGFAFIFIQRLKIVYFYNVKAVDIIYTYENNTPVWNWACHG